MMCVRFSCEALDVISLEQWLLYRFVVMTAQNTCAKAHVAQILWDFHFGIM